MIEVETRILDPESLARADWELLFSHLARDMDPWSVDLVELVRRFRGYLAELEALELEVPGRMLQAGAVLLRMKSDFLRDGDRQPPTLEEVLDEVTSEDLPVAEEVYIAPEFRLPLIRRPKARLGMADLRRALLAALAQNARRRPRRKVEPDDLGMELTGEPFSRRAGRLMRKLLSLVNGNRIIPLRRLLKRDDPREKVARFMELLHLDAEGKVRLFQEEFLGEVLIEVPRGTEGSG